MILALRLIATLVVLVLLCRAAGCAWDSGRRRRIAYCRRVVEAAELEASMRDLAEAGRWMLERDTYEDHRLPKERAANG